MKLTSTKPWAQREGHVRGRCQDQYFYIYSDTGLNQAIVISRIHFTISSSSLFPHWFWKYYTLKTALVSTGLVMFSTVLSLYICE